MGVLGDPSDLEFPSGYFPFFVPNHISQNNGWHSLSLPPHHWARPPEVRAGCHHLAVSFSFPRHQCHLRVPLPWCHLPLLNVSSAFPDPTVSGNLCCPVSLPPLTPASQTSCSSVLLSIMVGFPPAAILGLLLFFFHTCFLGDFIYPYSFNHQLYDHHPQISISGIALSLKLWAYLFPACPPACHTGTCNPPAPNSAYLPPPQTRFVFHLEECYYKPRLETWGWSWIAPSSLIFCWSRFWQLYSHIYMSNPSHFSIS